MMGDGDGGGCEMSVTAMITEEANGDEQGRGEHWEDVSNACFGRKVEGEVSDMGGHHGAAIRKQHQDARRSSAFVGNGGICHEIVPGTAGVSDVLGDSVTERWGGCYGFKTRHVIYCD
jgi:hypothetical protein